MRLWDANTGKHLRTLTEHTGNVTSVVFSPGGTILATGSSDMAVHLWRVQTGTRIRTLWHTDIVESVAFSPSGRTIATGQVNDSDVQLWRTSDGKNTGSLIGLTSSVENVAFSPEGNTIAAGSLNEFVLWDAWTGKPIRTIPDVSHVNSQAFSPDGNTVALGSRDGTIRLWEINTGRPLRTLNKHTYYVWSVAFSPDGQTIASGSYKEVDLWDASTGRLLRTLKGHTYGITSVAFSPDGQTIASGSRDKAIRLWDANTGLHIRSLKGHAYYVTSVAFSPDGQTIASGSEDDTVRLWDANTGRPLRTLEGHTRDVNSVSFSPDGQTIASGSDDETVRLWDTNTGKHIHTFRGHTDYVRSVSFSPDGQTIASGSEDRTIRLWDADTDTLLHTFEGHTYYVRSVSFSPDGQTIASGSDDETVRLWDTNTGKHIHTFRGHTDDVYSVAFSPDGQTIASGSEDDTIRLWNANTDAPIRTLTGHTHRNSVHSVSFSPDGQTIASPSGTEVQLWDAYTGILSRKFSHADKFSGNPATRLFLDVRSVSFSPDGQTIATGSDDDTVRLWDVNTGLHIRSLREHPSGVNSVSFSPDGKIIATGSDIGASRGPGADDPNVRLWDAHTGTLLRKLSHVANVNSVSFSPDGQTIASGGRGNPFAPTEDDYIVRLWDTNTGTLLHALKGHTRNVTSVAFSPDGKTIASGSWDRTLRLWDANAGTHLRTLEHANSVYSVAFSPDRQTLAMGSGSTVYLYDANTYTRLRTLSGHKWSVNSVAFSPDGSTLASGSSDGTVLLWEIRPAATSSTTVSLLPSTVQSPAIGKQLTFSLNIADGENVAGYQVTVNFDTSALRYVESKNADYLPAGAFFIAPVAEGNTVTLAASSLSGESSRDGTLATITFEVVAAKASTVRLSDVILTNSSGSSSVPEIENAEISEPPQLAGDVNEDGVVNIIDLTLVASNFGKQGQNAADVNADGVVNIIDLTLVAAAFGNTAAAPIAGYHDSETVPTRQQVQQWLREAHQLNLTDPAFQRGILILEQLLAALTPKETVLLPNYPNPFNPETWIPYQLATPAEVTLTIYAVDGSLVRTLALGHQPIGIYQDKSRAAYWDGKNAQGELVASGVYFYTLTAEKFTATRKMLIRK